MSTKPPASNRDPLEEATHGELVGLVRKLLARVEALEAENASLREQLRESKRAKAPISKGKGKTKPKRPGRRAGEGRFTTRPSPCYSPIHPEGWLSLVGWFSRAPGAGSAG